ncbi:hypothetical protein BDW02DRAFT_610376, partial [Decorospora gaudefroyi]
RQRPSTMSLPPLPQSADKSAIIARLGVSERVHRLLLHEAEAARDTLSANRSNLTAQSRLGPTLQAPYRWDEISETAKHLQILATVRNGGPETRPYYYMGRYITGAKNEENWVARWYLWHSFRYRDNRPRDRTPVGSAVQGGGGKYPYVLLYFAWGLVWHPLMHDRYRYPRILRPSSGLLPPMTPIHTCLTLTLSSVVLSYSRSRDSYDGTCYCRC